MNTNTNRIFEHLNLFSIDYYKQQQQQQQYDELKMTMMSDQHDKILQSNIKDEKHDHHVDNYFKSSLNSTDNIDQPLLIVLDEDDVNSSEENDQCNILTHKLKNEEQKIDIPNQDLSTVKQSLKNFRRPRKSRLFPSLNTHHHTSNKFIRTVVINTSFMRQTHRPKLFARRKNPSSLNMSTNLNQKILSPDDNSTVLSSTDSILSNISFDNISDILTVSRMGSIYYCLEDLHMKVFSSLCTLDEFTNLLSQPDLVHIKQVTLSEKISIEQQIPLLKKYNENRYRLISINSSDNLLKLKQLLLTMRTFDENEKQQREKRIDQIIDEMRSYKRTPTLVLLKDKVSHSPMTTKRLSSDDEDDDDEEEPRERLKIVTKKQKSNETPPLAPAQFGIFIQCNGPVSCNIFSTNETVSSATTTTSAETTTTTTTVAKTDSEIISKSTIIKKQNENTQIYFDKFSQHLSKFNLSNEQSTVGNRTDSQSPTDCTHNNKVCSSNMPIKRRILNSYTNESTTTTTVHVSPSFVNHSRCLYRSKSLGYNTQSEKNRLHRSSSLPSIRIHLKENFSTKKSLSKDQSSKLNMNSKSEPIDLTDGSYSMPMIVNVEENVEFNNQRHKVNSKKLPYSNKQKSSQVTPPSESESRPPSTVSSRSTSHESDPSILTKPIPIHPPISSSYRASPYGVYQQESYTYRDSSQNMSHPSSISSQSYHHPNNPMNNGNPYPYSFPSSTQYSVIKKPRESPLYDTRPNSVAPNHPPSSTNPNLSSAVPMPIVRKPNYYHQLTPEQQASIKMQTSPPASAPCRLPCCYQSPNIQQHLMDKPASNERTIYRQYTNVPTPASQTFKRDPSQRTDMLNSSSSMNRKQRRIESIPPLSTTPYQQYPPAKSYFAPPPPPLSSSSSASHWPSPSPVPSNPNIKPSIRYPYPPPPNTPMNGMARKMEPYPQPRRPTPMQSRAPPPVSTPVVVQNSSTLISPPNTPHELPLPNIRTRSIDLQRAIIERGYCDMDKLPKLVVRHTKTYSNRTVDTMGQLFPTWFNEPDYRCIHCFRCDLVFTPQQFMTHVDDELAQTEQPTSMTSIQLLTSEKMSEYKVGLWNQFCTNLTIYAREGRIGGFSTNRNQ
jgi:hypothetical protein